MAKAKATNKALTKPELIARIAEASGQPNKITAEFLSALEDVCTKELQEKGIVCIPGILKIKAVAKPATEERQGINPFTKAPITIPAKPASTRLKISPVKALKDAVAKPQKH